MRFNCFWTLNKNFRILAKKSGSIVKAAFDVSRQSLWENCIFPHFSFNYYWTLRLKKWEFWPKIFKRFVQNCISRVQKIFEETVFFHDCFCFFFKFSSDFELKTFRKLAVGRKISTGSSKMYYTCAEEVFEETVFFQKISIFNFFLGFLTQILTVVTVSSKTVLTKFWKNFFLN